MDHARILDRHGDGLLLIAPVAPAAEARPRLLALYSDHLPSVPERGRDAFLTGRAMVARGMRLLSLTPQAISPLAGANWHGDMTEGLAGATSNDSGQVAVWLQRNAWCWLGLDLREIEADSQFDELSSKETQLLSQQGSLARMQSDERWAGAVSAKHALSRALAPQLGCTASPAALAVRFSTQSGISLGLKDARQAGLHADDVFCVELRVMPGRVLTRVAVGRLARTSLC